MLTLTIWTLWSHESQPGNFDQRVQITEDNPKTRPWETTDTLFTYLTNCPNFFPGGWGQWAGAPPSGPHLQQRATQICKSRSEAHRRHGVGAGPTHTGQGCFACLFAWTWCQLGLAQAVKGQQQLISHKGEEPAAPRPQWFSLSCFCWRTFTALLLKILSVFLFSTNSISLFFFFFLKLHIIIYFLSIHFFWLPQYRTCFLPKIGSILHHIQSVSSSDWCLTSRLGRSRALNYLKAAGVLMGEAPSNQSSVFFYTVTQRRRDSRCSEFNVAPQ